MRATRRPRAPRQRAARDPQWDRADNGLATQFLLDPDLEALVRFHGKFGLTVAGACKKFVGQPTSKLAPRLWGLVAQGRLSFAMEARPPATRPVLVFRLAQKDLLS